MKKFISLLVLTVMFAPLTMASGDFSFGQNEDGLYYHSETHNLVYSKDASCLIGAKNGNAECSTLWYVKANKMRMTDAYYNRIRAMALLRAR